MDQKDAQNGQASENIEEADFEEMSMEALLAEGDYMFNIPSKGDVRTGVIASVSGDEVLVSIGAKSEGVIPGKEISQLSDEEREALHVGKEVTVYVISPESRQGTLILSLTRALEEDDWARAEEFKKSNEIFEGKINGYNKGGLIVNFGHLRGFVPASQVSLTRRMSYSGDTPEQRWKEMVGSDISVRVIEVDRQRRRLILSEKAASSETRETIKDRLMTELSEGEVRKGRVTSLADFGAFVNINGADGLVHLSEISWDRIEHPSEVLKVGDEIDVKIINLDIERRRIGLSIRQLQSDPWEARVSEYQEGQLIEAKITRLTKFGAFAQLEDDLEGLIHVSELSDKRVEHPKEVVNEGDVVALRVIKIDASRRRIGLSLRKVDSMKYSEMDWELALAEIEGFEGDGEEKAPEAAATEDAAPKDAAEEEAVVEETAADETAVEEEAVAEETAADETAVEEESAEEEAVEEETAVEEEAVEEDAPAEEPEA